MKTSHENIDPNANFGQSDKDSFYIVIEFSQP